MSNADLKLDPLYTIFEKHLYDFEDNEESEENFVNKIVEDYMTFLSNNSVAVPAKWRHSIAEELRDQVRKMLVKKMYGCLSIKEFIHRQTDRQERRKRARRKYSKFF